jgi:hypothetical protein
VSPVIYNTLRKYNLHAEWINPAELGVYRDWQWLVKVTIMYRLTEDIWHDLFQMDTAWAT